MLAALVACVMAIAATASQGASEGPGASPSTICPRADAGPGDATKGQLRAALLCMINQARADAGKDRYRADAKLRRPAQRHTAVMLHKDCFAHKCRGEPRLDRRVRRSGYLKGAKAWSYAESTGCDATATKMVEAWLEVRFHRKNLLSGRFSDVGIGVGKGAPTAKDEDLCQPEERFTTFTVVFGWRRA